MSQTLIVELNCPRCNFTKVIQIGLDEDGVYSIPNKFCPNDMHALSRKVLPNVPVPVKKDEPEQDKTESPNSVPERPGSMDRTKNGAGNSKKTG